MKAKKTINKELRICQSCHAVMTKYGWEIFCEDNVNTESNEIIFVCNSCYESKYENINNELLGEEDRDIAINENIYVVKRTFNWTKFWEKFRYYFLIVYTSIMCGFTSKWISLLWFSWFERGTASIIVVIIILSIGVLLNLICFFYIIYGGNFKEEYTIPPARFWKIIYMLPIINLVINTVVFTSSALAYYLVLLF